MDKTVKSLREAIAASGLKSGMTVSFHHHLRNGDMVLNMVTAEISALGIKDITVNASSLFDVHAPLAEHIKSGVVTKIITDYMSQSLGERISRGLMEKPVEFRTHGGRPAAIISGETPVDVAFVAAPCADREGNCSGKYGKSACGSLGYAFADAQYAKKTVVITDGLCERLDDFSIDGKLVDFVAEVPQIGDPKGIVSGTITVTRDPIGLVIARDTAEVIQASGLLKDGFNFQTGAGGATLAAAKFLEEIMLKEGIKGGYGLGGITSYMVKMLEEGLFSELRDVQCFDLEAVRSIQRNSHHKEISAYEYAAPTNPNAAVNGLDVVVLGATEIDTEFNVNVHTDSRGIIMGGSGGHSDAAAGAKLAIVAAPLFRARQPIVTEKVGCVSTEGKDIDVLVTQYGIAVNPKDGELHERLVSAGLDVKDIRVLKEKAESITGVPEELEHGKKVVAEVIGRDGKILDRIYNKL